MKYKPRSKFREMKLFVFYDLPSVTKIDKQNYSKFRSDLLKDGYIQIQESVYVKHCYNKYSVDKSNFYLKSIIPPNGDIRTLLITTKQYEENMQIIRGKKSIREMSLEDDEMIVI